MRNGGCNKLAACINTPGSRTCGACPEDFAGNGYVGCFDANECPNGDCTSRLPLGFETAEAPVITTSGDVTVPAAGADGAAATFAATAQDKVDGKVPRVVLAGLGFEVPGGQDDGELLGDEQPWQAADYVICCDRGQMTG